MALSPLEYTEGLSRNARKDVCQRQTIDVPQVQVSLGMNLAGFFFFSPGLLGLPMCLSVPLSPVGSFILSRSGTALSLSLSCGCSMASLMVVRPAYVNERLTRCAAVESANEPRREGEESGLKGSKRKKKKSARARERERELSK
mmetsp:Transcript_42757/g.84339  ORF Transcript_42757/g.84339 Transcript_42757/m.84339 type:complete len:144 (+) Transcript_42757:974-1405(+)